ncbi:MAG: hypothetical protein LRY71_01695 [Bacillaceae bacterium]|nr:hypothetical protein [Bacillaceae bacterium]
MMNNNKVLELSNVFENKEVFIKSFVQALEQDCSKDIKEASEEEIFFTLGTMVRKHVSKSWIQTNKQYKENNKKQVIIF